ncbi:MAG: ATP-grasp domain-containing protein [Actinomycetota bacterium]|nr:ATP-grasp domain-containing protein [Actinomycetota bacterium]
MPRVLLILPTGTYRAADFVRAASVLRTEVVVASEHRQAMAASMEDRALVLPLDRPEAAAAAIVAFAARSPIDAVVAVDEQGVLPAALAAARLGLAHNPPPAVAATRDKLATRVALAVAGIDQPAFRAARPGDDVAALAMEVGLPCVVKPVSLSGSRGVIRADDPPAAQAAAQWVRAILADAGEDPEGPVLVEAFAPGVEVAVEGLLRAGELEVLAVFDKPDPLDGPYFEETIYVTPSRLDASTQDAVAALVAAGTRALGLSEGPVHAEVRVGDGDLRLIEVAARSIGGLCSRALSFGAGISLEEVILRHALGLGLDDLHREDQASGVMMLPIPRSGRLVEVGGLDAAQAVPGIEGVEVTIARGRMVRALPEGDRYLGFLFARAPTPEEVEAALRQAHAHLDVVISDEA